MERPRFVVTTFPLLSLHHAEPRGFGRFVGLEAVSLGVWRDLGIAYGFGGGAGSFEADARSAARYPRQLWGERKCADSS